MLTVEEMEALQKAVRLVLDSDEIMDQEGLVEDEELEAMHAANKKLQKMIEAQQ